MRVLWIGPQGSGYLRQFGDEFEVSAPPLEDALRTAEFGGTDVIVASTWGPDAHRIAQRKAVSVQMIAVIPPTDADAIREAVRAGVSDLVWSLDDLPQALRTLPAPSSGAAARAAFHGRVLTVAGAHGGCGRTTLAVNLALALALQTEQPVLLWDCVPYFGSCHVALGLGQDTGIDALGGGDAGLDAQLVAPYDGVALRLLPAPRTIDAAGTYTAPAVASTLERLRALAPWVVIDTERIPLPGLEPAMANADLLVVLARFGVAQARALRGYLDTVLRTYPSDRLVLCATASPRRPLWASRGVTSGTLLEFAGITIEHVLPFDPAVLAADDTGVPPVYGAQRSPYARAVHALGAALMERLERGRTPELAQVPTVAPARA